MKKPLQSINMTEEDIREHLKAGGWVTYDIWAFSAKYMNCHEPGCCEADLSGVDDAIKTIKLFTDNDLKDVEKSKI